MSDFDLERIRANWNRSLAEQRARANSHDQEPLPRAKPEAAPGDARTDRDILEAGLVSRVTATALVDRVEAFVAAEYGGQHPALQLLLAEARVCARRLDTSETGGATTSSEPTASRLIALVEQLEDLLEVYGGIGFPR